ncbi:Cyclic di-GMP phosphodiesterase response regulator RpfG [Rosistilla ulvae]|uniref:Cyclic di-GMP phosphodiesterase response regulator RpfG n=1 Tax=Rosistilla ulvae TaxID=1930277 RepID=A0A517M6W4_9BACT|nr:HD-GYP domain-containing protein [Rosistilla ulvae]QDS90621.1 Cyclic di-GMP phosphodiesterase response regulator RpfG [Rosistilla ulvae]
MADSALASRTRCTDDPQFDPDALIQQVESLEQEVQSLTEQVTRDFEELALLQSLAVSMELRTSTPEPMALMLDFLPKLPLSTMCQAVALVPNIEMFADHKPNEGNAFTLWSGDPLVEDDVCRKIIATYGENAKVDPVVINDLAADQIDSRIRDIILVEIRHADRLAGWLIACNHVKPAGTLPGVRDGFTTIEANLILTAGSILATQLHNTRLLRQKEQLFTDVVRAMVNAVEARDDYTCGHSERVALFAKELAREAGLTVTDCDRIYLTGLLHDVGKIAVPDAVLQKPGLLNAEERSVIETHPDVGWRILYPLVNQLSEVLPGVLFHHERIDGKGYPDGLVGEEIPLDGRILAISDAYDAMTSDRPYRGGMPQEKAEEILRSGAGTQWDADLIGHFFDAMPRMVAIRESYNRREPQARQHGSYMPVEG